MHRRAPRPDAPSTQEMELHETESLLSILNMIASPRTSADERMYALVQLEHFVAQRVLKTLPVLKQHASEHATRPSAYLAQVDRCCDWTVPVRDARLYMAEQIFAHVARLRVVMEIAGDDRELRTLAAEMGCSLSLLQGMCLTHYPSKQLCSMRSAFELLLSIVESTYAHATHTDAPLRLLASHALDTLMCILVDAPAEVRGVFEQVGGVATIRRVMHTHQAEKNEEGPQDAHVTAAKCFEFLLFYLQAGVFEEQAAAQLPTRADTYPAAVFDPPPPPPPPPPRSSGTETPFYTPNATPRAHARVLSTGSPTKTPSARLERRMPDMNPFTRPDETPRSHAALRHLRTHSTDDRRHVPTHSTEERRHLRARSTDQPFELSQTPRARGSRLDATPHQHLRPPFPLHRTGDRDAFDNTMRRSASPRKASRYESPTRW
ncbi:hypothetical protein MVES_003275 [Malassezia vespertilionis]|uniref:Uncharacterized protein n=1 Tax=Malassezia vespertilionis TaxID=2020962 RepID=A0A2N1J8G1_9BASI|nr:hypothetical protein MVES_003275 [Malassezia vespertilionis]